MFFKYLLSVCSGLGTGWEHLKVNGILCAIGVERHVNKKLSFSTRGAIIGA